MIRDEIDGGDAVCAQIFDRRIEERACDAAAAAVFFGINRTDVREKILSVMIIVFDHAEPAVNDWKRFLAAGGSVPPAQMAKLAGIDITTDGPLNATIDYIGSVIDEIIRLTEEIDGVICD